jgi:hypothetical protein
VSTPLPTEPVAVPRALGARQLRKGHFSLALIMIAAGGVLAAIAFYSVTNTNSYLAVTRRVPAGSTLTNADLRSVQLNDAPGLAAVPASQRRRMVGRRTTVTLLPGQTLVADAITSGAVLQRGQRQVGVKLIPGQLPADRLHAGDAVLVIQTPVAKGVGTTQTQTDAGALGQWDATVVGSSPVSESDGSTVLYLAVDNADTAQIATLASAGQLVVVLAGSR